jgi:hypothetical protein
MRSCVPIRLRFLCDSKFFYRRGKHHEGTSRAIFVASVSQVIRMSVKNGKSAIELL